jgi:hypothetical protein
MLSKASQCSPLSIIHGHWHTEIDHSVRVGTALSNKSILQSDGGRSGEIRNDFACGKTDNVQT